MWTSLLSCAAIATTLLTTHATAQVTPLGTVAFPFDFNQVTLSDSRFKQNQDRTLTYLKWVDPNRLLYNFRATHGHSTAGAQSPGGWDKPDFPFRSHFQGHILTAWVQCALNTGDATCRSRATSFVAELLKCQQNNAAKGYTAGYLSGFPESEFQKLESSTLTNGNVPYYALHKTMAGVLDVWRYLNDSNARTVVLAMAAWIDTRTSRLSTAQMQTMLQTEFGGMTEVLADLYHQTGDKRWLSVATRFEHAAVLDPLAANQDRLNGLHANTQVPKWIGAARQYKATGTQRYLDIARTAWRLTVGAHSYAIGGNSQAEHFRPANAIAGYLTSDTAEACNSYNMLKLTRELWSVDPQPAYFDFYEQALLNHLLGQQRPGDSHGHVTYFTPLNPGGRRGVGPAWGGGTWSTDYDSFWCCQGTGVETHTKFWDSVYWRDDTTLWVNLFTASTVDWTQKGVKVTQTTTFPAGDTTTLTVNGAGDFGVNIRIPAWASGPSVTVNGQAVAAQAGSYVKIRRTWKAGDKVVVKLPMKLRTVAANDNAGVAAVHYGPVTLSGNYGNAAVASMPSLALNTLKQTGALTFSGTANGAQVVLSPFFDAHDVNYNVYWKVSGSLPG